MADDSSVTNHWTHRKCAKAFWGQRDLPPYKRLLADTVEWLKPQPQERWIDLGCGSGQLTRMLWEKSAGALCEVVALDCAAANEHAIHQVRAEVQPTPTPQQMRFVHANFSERLSDFADCSFDGAVSGLAIQYAESYSTERGCWTTDSYDQALQEVYRLLRPGGRFVFSVNVPEPAWGKIALHAIHGFFLARRPLRYLKNAMRMWRYGTWLKREARRGRFHYLPAETIHGKLASIGYTDIEHRISFCGQAYIVRCWRPAN